MIPASKIKKASGGGNNPEAAGPNDFVGDLPCPQVPAPTAFTERYSEVEEVANEQGVDLAAKVQAMTIADNPGLKVPGVSLAQPPMSAPMPGTLVVSLSDSSSSSSSSEAEPPAEDAAAAKAALTMAKAAASAVAPQDAIEAARMAAQAATEHMKMID